MSENLADFAAFYDATLPQVYRYVAYRVAESTTAEDLTSAIFESALRAWKGRRKPEAVMPWIFRIARNTVISHYRRNGHWTETPLDEATLVPATLFPEENSTPEQRLLDAERRQGLRKALHTLTEREQDVIALKFGGGLTNRAIAPILSLSESNVAVILHRALGKVRATLAQIEEQGSRGQG